MTMLPCVGAGLVLAAQAEETRTPAMTSPGMQAAAAPGPAEARQVGVYHLKYADSADIAKELSSTLAPDDFKIVADRPSNSVVAVAPARMLKTIEDVIAKLDVPYTAPAARVSVAPDNTSTIKAVRINGVSAEYLARALEGILSAQSPNQANAPVAVVRASPATQRAVQELASKVSANKQGANKQSGVGRDAGTHILYVPGVSAAAVARALAVETIRQERRSAEGARAGQESQPRVVVVVPPRATTGQSTQRGSNLARR